MHHDSTARPTLQVLRSLHDGWQDKFQQRAVQDGRYDCLHPFAALRHPILRKCAQELSSDPARDGEKRTIKVSGALHLLEIRSSQWRAGVWTDGDGVRWIVATGLAKGGHDDHDDFYRTLELCCSETGRQSLLPTSQDVHLLKLETAALVRTRWELDIQRTVADMLRRVGDTPSVELSIRHPVKDCDFARVRLTVATAEDVEDYVVQVKDLERPGSPLAQLLERRILVSISRPVQAWDVAHGVYSAMEEPGHLLVQIASLDTAIDADELLLPDLGNQAHRVHRRHVGDASINGNALRALCGVFFVPTQDAERLEECPQCQRVVAGG